MTLTPAQKEWRKPAQARASQIRMGMRSYIETLGLIHVAWEQQDHVRLGYPSWEAYYNAEFSEERVQLTPEMRNKAIAELRIAGMSQREIAVSTGLSAATVNRHLARVADETDILEGDIVPPADSPIVDAMKQAIRNADERNETAGLAGPAPDVEQATTPSGTAAAGNRVDSPAAAPDLPTAGAPVRGVSRETGEAGRSSQEPPVPASSTTDHPGTSSNIPGEGAGSAPAPEEPPVCASGSSPKAAGGAANTTPPAAPSSPSEVQRPGEPAGTGEPTENGAGSSAVTGEPAPQERTEESVCPTCGQPRRSTT